MRRKSVHAWDRLEFGILPEVAKYIFCLTHIIYFEKIHTNRDFNRLTGDASYALYTQLFLNVPAGSFLECTLNISNMSTI